jgi:PAS domain S-box-containing protein
VNKLKNIRIPLFLKFVLLLVLLSVGPLVFVGIRTVNINRIALQTSILELHTALAESFSEKTYDYLKVVHNEIPYITQILSMDLPWAQLESMLKTMLDLHENFVSISLLDNTGKEKYKVYNPFLEKKPQLLNLKGDVTFQTLLKEKKARSISPIYYYDESLPCLNLFYKPAKGTFIISINISLKPLWDKLNKIRIGKTGHAFLVDEQGRIIAHKSSELLFKSAADIGIVRQSTAAFTGGSSEYTDEKGNATVGAYATVPDLGWSVIVQQPKKEAYYSSILMRRQAIYLIVISILLASTFAFFIARSLTKPVLALIKAAGRIAQRDFSAKVEVKTRDELNDLINIFNDMSAELKKYEDIQLDRLIAEKTKTEAVIFSVGEGIVMTDYKGEILLINSQARGMLSIEKGNLEGKYLRDYLPNEQLVNTLNEVIKEPGSKKEIDLSTEDRLQFYQAGTKPVVTLKGEKLGVVTVLRDITLEKELDKMKDDFLHSITHDLRNPMTSIRGFLKFMQEGIGGPLTDQQKKMVDTMDRASIRLLGMINDILDLSKLESGKIELQLVDTNFVDITNRVIDLLQPQITRKKITMNISVLNHVSPTRADPKLIERTINNLIGNALKFTPENGSVTMSIEDKPDKIEVGVLDTGDGVPADYLDKIFDKFGQVTGHKKGGTGLGLTICKYIVETHKGKIWVESESGQGAKFSFSIPKNLTKEMLSN